MLLAGGRRAGEGLVGPCERLHCAGPHSCASVRYSKLHLEVGHERYRYVKHHSFPAPSPGQVPDVTRAMELGRDAAMEVSKSFPPPVKLEFEKVSSAAVFVL